MKFTSTGRFTCLGLGGFLRGRGLDSGVGLLVAKRDENTTTTGLLKTGVVGGNYINSVGVGGRSLFACAFTAPGGTGLAGGRGSGGSCGEVFGVIGPRSFMAGILPAT